MRETIASTLSKVEAPITIEQDLSFVDWIENNIYIPETSDHRLKLAPYQKRVFTEALKTNEHGDYVYSTVVWSDVKKSLKSLCAAGRALYAADSKEWSTVYVIANDLKQADSRVAYYIRRAIELNPDLKRRCKINRYTIELDNHSRIEAIPIDPSGEAGSNADLLIFSELWGWKHESAKRMWTEMTLSPTKFGKSQRWVETYAGFIGDSPILEMLYETAVEKGTQIDSNLELYANGSILALWNTQPRLSWQTPEYYASEATILAPSEFDRVHRNQWAQSSDAFVTVEQWDACKLPYPVLDRWTPVTIGIDAAAKRDTFAMVGVSRVWNGERHITYVRFCFVWTPPENGEIDFKLPYEKLRSVCQEYNVEGVAFDPTQMTMFASMVQDEGFVHMFEYKQGTPREESDMMLYDAVRERTIVHDDDPTLTQHIVNANKELSGERRMRIVKRGTLPNDAAVALSMANKYAADLRLG